MIPIEGSEDLPPVDSYVYLLKSTEVRLKRNLLIFTRHELVNTSLKDPAKLYMTVMIVLHLKLLLHMQLSGNPFLKNKKFCLL